MTALFKQLAVPSIQDDPPGQPSATTRYPSRSDRRFIYIYTYAMYNAMQEEERIN